MLIRAMPLAILVGLWSVTAHGASLTFTDPAGDDFGPGTYTYPTDSVYAKGTFDLRKLEMIDKGSKVEFHVTLGTRVTDPWDSAKPRSSASLWTLTSNGNLDLASLTDLPSLPSKSFFSCSKLFVWEAAASVPTLKPLSSSTACSFSRL